MLAPTLLHQLVAASASLAPDSLAFSFEARPGSPRAGTLQHASYAQLAEQIGQCASGMMDLGLQRGERVAIYIEKRPEAVVASFAAAAAGLCFVPVNPLLKAEQVGYILRDCNVRLLLSSPGRLAALAPVLAQCPDLRFVVATDTAKVTPAADVLPSGPGLTAAAAPAVAVAMGWDNLLEAPPRSGHRVVDRDMAAILYTSGSTGHPKGVVLSHHNLVAGAHSVVSYLQNNAQDVLLAALPLSFDAGFSQLTTAFLSGARVVLLNYLLPRDLLKTMARERVTGLTAVPPLYMQLASQVWPDEIRQTLRYFANTGGHMPLETLKQIRQQVPAAQPFLMYGLTEAFRSTYLPPEQVDVRPDSIGKAIPNAEILVLREDGSLCDADEPGELVHRGALVAQGYWNDAEKTAERFKPLPGTLRLGTGLQLPELAVFSGDTVRRDAEGYLYFVARRDDMIKTSGYRVSPLEVEEILYGSPLVAECVAFGVPHASLEQVIQVVLAGHGTGLPDGAQQNTPSDAALKSAELLGLCKARLPAYMVPFGLHWATQALPRNPNGKLDRKAIAGQWASAQAAASTDQPASRPAKL